MWDFTQPFKYLDDSIRKHYVYHANFLYNDLLSNRLVVILAPAPYPMHEDHKVRVIENQNPLWYRKLYCSHNHFRRDRSLNSLVRLRNLVDKTFNVSSYKYDEIYRELIHKHIIEGAVFDSYKLNPNPDVREFFGIEDLLIEKHSSCNDVVGGVAGNPVFQPNQAFSCNSDDEVPF